MTDNNQLRVKGDVTFTLAQMLERAADISNSKGYHYLGVEHVALAMLENRRWYGTEAWDRPLTIDEWQKEIVDGLPPLPAIDARSNKSVTVEYVPSEPPSAAITPCPFVQEFEFQIFTTEAEVADLAAVVDGFVRTRAESVNGLSWQTRHCASATPKPWLERRWRAAHTDIDPGERRNLSIYVGLHLVDSVKRDELFNDLCAMLPVSDATWTAGMTTPESDEQARAFDLRAKYPELAHLERQ